MAADDDTTKPKATGSDGDGNVDDGHEEAAETLANLLQNQAAISTNVAGAAPNADGSTGTCTGTGGAAAATTTTPSVGGGGGGNAQEAAIQQMLQHLKLGGAVALPSDGDDAERKHAFWDTQVRGVYFCSCCLFLVARI